MNDRFPFIDANEFNFWDQDAVALERLDLEDTFDAPNELRNSFENML